MKRSFISTCFALASVLAIASPDVQAQRGGGHGGGMGGAVGGGFGSGMSSGMNRGGPMGAMPSERFGGVSNADRSVGSDRSSRDDRAKTPAQLLQQNTKLQDGLAKLLPAGTDLQAAAAGFRNLGEFVAAAHVSSNLGIPFADLKTKMMAGDSLGDAIHALRPDADAQVEARKARSRAENDMAKG